MPLPDRGGPLTPPIPVPGLPWVPSYAWINTEPLNLTLWRGNPVLIEVWSMRCNHCRRTLPWLKAMEKRFGPRGLKTLAVHTPEFPEDHDVGKVRDAVAELEIDTPVVMDNQYDYWRALSNRYWPTLYLVDRLGQIRYRRVGELLENTPDALETEKWLEELLDEPSPSEKPAATVRGEDCC